ncbi:hypothetical protein J4Q44_G00082780 [Coregonus suidteri]|uniref:HTH La-type RNA-binding domain-containing protein n=1 Tax=Coregonus suidteri TaxID=861788 RepID=A0AAN8M5V7_9TELE
MSSEHCPSPQKPEVVKPVSEKRGQQEITSKTDKDQGGMVTTKGAGLNPNAKVWQEIPAPQSQVTEGTHWLETTPASDVPEGYSEAPPTRGKVYGTGYSDPSSDSSARLPTEGVLIGMDPPELGYPLYDSVTESAVEEQQPLSEESLRESLKKQLEFCFSRENLSKDLYLMSQMDSDQFIPIWTIASMEGIKFLTTDMDLILEVLRASPVVQVDEMGEKVRPNHKRCIIILREVPETTPVEEVEALFKNENCPKVISVEFVANNNWYITFQSDTDAQQAHRYLREEVKTFQGNPIMARIKAINTFFAKNGYRSVPDSSVYSQQGQSQSQYSSTPLYMQQVYSPQQQYPLYPLVPPTWNPSPAPYFETPLAPFPNSGFVNGFSTPGNYKTGNSPLGLGRPPFNRNRVPLYSRKNVINAFRNHAKSQPRPCDEASPPSVTPVSPLVDGLSGPSSALPPRTAGAPLGSTPEPGPAPPSLTSLTIRDTLPLVAEGMPNGDLGIAGRGRRGSYRGMRRRREDERITRPIPLSEIKVPQPKFDLAASNFPPLPGCVVSTQGEPVLETRMSDVVRGLKVTSDKPDVSKESVAPPASAQKETVSVPSPVTPAPKPPTPPVVEPPVPSVAHPVKKVEKAEPHVQKEMTPTPAPPSSLPTPTPPSSLPTPSQPAAATKPTPTPTHSQPISTATPVPATTTPAPESRKLSYAEMCKRPATQPPEPSTFPKPPTSSASQPLRELRVNKADEPAASSSSNGDRSEKPERSGEGRPHRDPLGSYCGVNGPARSGGMGLKYRDQQRGASMSRRISPQGWARRSGKEQNIPPRSPK